MQGNLHVVSTHSSLTQCLEDDIEMSSRMLWFCNFHYSNHIITSFCKYFPWKNLKTFWLTSDQFPKMGTKTLILYSASVFHDASVFWREILREFFVKILRGREKLQGVSFMCALLNCHRPWWSCGLGFMYCLIMHLSVWHDYKVHL